MIAVYDSFSDSFAKSREKIWPDLQELMNLPELTSISNWIIYDIGCWSWRLLEYFLQKPNPKSYIGIDISEGMLIQARQRYPEYLFVHQSMTDSLERIQVDAILYIASFHHLLTTAEQELTLSIAKKSLKKGGKIIFLNWNLTAAHLLKRYPLSSFEPVRTIPYNGNVRQYRAWWLDEFSEFLRSNGYRVDTARVTDTLANMIHIATPI